MSALEHEEAIAAAIQRIADTAEAFAAQAGVGGAETAGLIVSFLAEHPDWTGAFFKRGSTFDLPDNWFETGCLTWSAENGKVVHPTYARRSRIIAKIAREAA